MSHNAVIEGVFTLTSPLHVSSFDSRQPFQAINADRDANASRMYSMPVCMVAPSARGNGSRASAGASEDDLDAMLEDDEPQVEKPTGRPTLIPIVPGNTIRGRLRSACSGMVLRALADNAQVISDRHYYSLRKGRASVSGAKETSNLEVLMKAQDDIFSGLWGLETKLPSAIETGYWFPIIDGVTTLMVPEAYRDAAVVGITPRQLYYLHTLRSVDDLQAGKDALAEGVWEGGREGMIAYVASRAEATAAANSARSAAKRKKAAGEAVNDDAKKVDFNNIFGYECVLPMTPLYGRVRVHEVARIEHVGLALAGMAQLLREQGIGGASRIGFGSFDARLDVTLDGERYAGALRAESGRVSIAPEVQALIERAQSALGCLTVDDIAAIHGVLTKVSDAAELEDA